ncbi:MAG: amidohydrolase family protein [Lachnospiraceae bacterium]|nr:amidohydrolase family protein [Lachnospiraceae bacterium]
MKLTGAKIILERGILEGTVSVSGERIAYLSAEKEEGIDLTGYYLLPGFVDNHCHGSGEHWFYDEPAKAALWHLREGTTSIHASLWRNKPCYPYPETYARIRQAQKTARNIRGIHMEGPYVDPHYGADAIDEWPVRREEYLAWMEAGNDLVDYWTIDPNLPGIRDFALEAQRRNIHLGVCYSEVKPELLEQYVDLGLTIGTHILCGTGKAKPMFAGTYEPGSDEFVLVDDRMYAEVIADSLGGHVRPYYLKLIYKCKGPDRTILVSDCCACGDTFGSDVNVINGELYGSRLTLSVAIRNMKKHTGAGIVELAKMASTTPAKALGLYAERGSIAPGKIADLVILDRDLMVKGVLLGGEWVRKEF